MAKSKIILSNVADTDIMKDVQLKTFELLRTYLEPSFGPKGSNSAIMNRDEGIKYTKDGHTILKSIVLQNPIETSIKNSLEELTRNIVLKVGDGTTSAVILSEIVFRRIREYLEEHEVHSYDFMETFNRLVKEINKNILSNAEEFTPNFAFAISNISTNGNKGVSNTIADLYTKYGNEVYIDVKASMTEDTIIKEFDGLILDDGIDDVSFVNTGNGKAHIRNPRIFMFKDPIDSPDFGVLFDAIIAHTFNAAQANDGVFEPTVIMAPSISVDYSATISDLCNTMSEYPIAQKPPVLVLGNVTNNAKYEDLKELCGAKFIKKYIDPTIQQQDIEKGLAATPETIMDFAGSAELVESDSTSTKIINPANMYDEDGKPTVAYSSLLEFLESSLEDMKKTGEDIKDIHALKKRIQSLKSCMVEYYVGGLTMMDRDSLKDLVEDAVLNCRSAAKNGYGAAANAVGLWESYKIYKDDEIVREDIEKDILKIIYKSYKELVESLIKLNTTSSNDDIDKIIDSIIEKECAYNVKTGEFDASVVTSIYTDVYILEAIAKIITLMVTSNQFIVPDVNFNMYLDKEKL